MQVLDLGLNSRGRLEQSKGKRTSLTAYPGLDDFKGRRSSHHDYFSKVEQRCLMRNLFSLARFTGYLHLAFTVLKFAQLEFPHLTLILHLFGLFYLSPLYYIVIACYTASAGT